MYHLLGILRIPVWNSCRYAKEGIKIECIAHIRLSKEIGVREEISLIKVQLRRQSIRCQRLAMTLVDSLQLTLIHYPDGR